MARPGATFLEDVLVPVIFRKQKAWNSSIPSQVWAREYWNGGMMGLKEGKQSNMIFSASTAHYSIIPTFHHSMWMG